MIRRPNPILHMLFWGTGSGTILALLYIVFFLTLGTTSFIDTLLMFVQPFTWFYALLFGGFPGAVLGLITGFTLRGYSIGFDMPFTRAEMQSHRYRVYALIGMLTTILGFILTFLFFGASSFSYMGFLLLFPPFIAGIAAAYAAHRYMFRLRLWSEQQYGVQKEKSKNFEHLEDKVEEIDYDDGKEEKSNQRMS